MHVAKGDSITLSLVQLSARRREWHLKQGEEVRVRLRVPPVRSGARAEAAGRPLRIERHGRVRSEYVVRDETTGEEVAHLRHQGRRLVLELNGRVGEWKRLGRKEGFGFVGQDGKPFLRAKTRSSGFARTAGEVQIGAGVTEREALIAALLASYILIRKNDDEAAASVAVTTVVVAS